MVNFTNQNGLEIDFNPTNILEISIRGKWVAVTPNIFRSWSGNRRVNGQSYEGSVYFLGTNNSSEVYQTQTA